MISDNYISRREKIVDVSHFFIWNKLIHLQKDNLFSFNQSLILYFPKCNMSFSPFNITYILLSLTII